MKQIDKMTKEEWKELGDVTKNMQRATLKWQFAVTENFGKSHPTSKKVMNLLKNVMNLKSELDDLLYAHAGYMFPDDAEISSVFYGDSNRKDGQDKPQSK